MIKINNISKIYSENSGNFNISLNVPIGSCYGTVGPKDFGKTTLVSQILGFIKSESGNVTINNVDSWKNREEIMEITGYVTGEISLYNDFTGHGYLKLQSKIHKNLEWNYVENLVQYFDIDIKKKIKKMSKGMKQKIAIISAVISNPKILIIYETTSGLDPIMQK